MRRFSSADLRVVSPPGAWDIAAHGGVQQIVRPPSAADVEGHARTHLPHQPWCAACRRGRAKELPHRSAAGGVGREFHLDFAFPEKDAGVCG